MILDIFPIPCLLLTFSASSSVLVTSLRHRKPLHLFNSTDATITMAKGTSCRPTASPLRSPFLSQPSTNPWFSGSGMSDEMDQDHILVASLILIVIASTVGVFLLLFTILKILGYYWSRRIDLRTTHLPILFDIHGDSRSSDGDEPSLNFPIFINTVGLHQSVIDSITVFKYRKEEGLIEGITECSVCLCEFQQDESLRLLPKCTHAFHIRCIDAWFRSHQNCPLCRAPIVDHTSGTEARVTMPDLNVSVQNQETQIEILDGESSNINRDDDDDDSDVIPTEVQQHIQPMRRSASVDSSSASMICPRLVGLGRDIESSETETHFHDKRNWSSKNMAIGKQGSGSSTIYKMASIGRVLQKKPISFTGSSSHNPKFLFSRHSFRI